MPSIRVARCGVSRTAPLTERTDSEARTIRTGYMPTMKGSASPHLNIASHDHLDAREYIAKEDNYFKF
jgi:hypothetical protein